MAKAGRPTYSPQEADRVRAVAAELFRERFESKNARLGEALGISGQAVGKFLSGAGGFSTQTVERIAAMKGVTVDQLLGRKVGELRVERPHRYPNARIAADFAIAEGVDPAAVEWVLAGNHSLGEDAMPSEWLIAMQRREREQRRAVSALAVDAAAAAREADAHQALMDERARAGAPKMPKRRK